VSSHQDLPPDEKFSFKLFLLLGANAPNIILYSNFAESLSFFCSAAATIMEIVEPLYSSIINRQNLISGEDSKELQITKGYELKRQQKSR
jgi:hypothetical protein